MSCVQQTHLMATLDPSMTIGLSASSSSTSGSRALDTAGALWFWVLLEPSPRGTSTGEAVDSSLSSDSPAACISSPRNLLVSALRPSFRKAARTCVWENPSLRNRSSWVWKSDPSSEDSSGVGLGWAGSILMSQKTGGLYRDVGAVTHALVGFASDLCDPLLDDQRESKYNCNVGMVPISALISSSGKTSSSVTPVYRTRNVRDKIN